MANFCLLQDVAGAALSLVVVLVDVFFLLRTVTAVDGVVVVDGSGDCFNCLAVDCFHCVAAATYVVVVVVAVVAWRL